MARSRTQSKSTSAEAKAAPAKARTSAKAKTDTPAKAKAQAGSNGSPAATAKPRRSSRKAVPAAIGHEQIAAKAYEIWEAKGRPLGMDEQNWQEAEAALAAR